MNKQVAAAAIQNYESAPTPTPWYYVPSTEHHGPYITSNYGGTIADLYTMSYPAEPSTASGGRSKPVSFFHEMADPNAELIVRAVNNHAGLVEALGELLNCIDGQHDHEWLARCKNKAIIALRRASNKD